MDVFVDWKFWSLVVSFIAVALSQMPPIKFWFRPRRLLVEVHSRILVSHRIGNPNIALYLSVHNSGGKRIRVLSSSISISRDGKSICGLPAQNYFKESDSKSSVLFVPYHLNPDETWAHITNFFEFFDRETEKNYRGHVSNLNRDIRAKLEKRPKSKSKELVVAKDDLVAPFKELFAKEFVWVPGEYIAELNIKTNQASASFLKKYRFTLFESDTAELKAQSERFKFGEGVTYDLDGVYVTLPLAEHND